MSGKAALQRAARLRALLGGPMACARPGCTALGQPTYCSRRCSGIDLWRRLPDNHFERIGQLSGKARYQKVGSHAIRPSELRLMAAGRFKEAAILIYDRAYGSGWTAGRRGHRQRISA